MRKKPEPEGLVWSSAHGRMCPGCGKPVKDCACGEDGTPPGGAGKVSVRRETKGRKGKGVTVITGLPLSPADLKRLAKKLKQRLSSGGTVKDGTIEIQGDHAAEVREMLTREGLA
jgi:translation initiation factor 1